MPKTKYYLSSTSMHNAIWRNIWIDHVKTPFEMNRKGKVRYINSKREIKAVDMSDGYKAFGLRVRRNTRIRISRHRLLAALFIPIPQKYIDMGLTQLDLEVNHKDGIKGSDDLGNLEWMTPKENIIHAHETGLYPPTRESNISISEEKAREILSLLETDISFREIAKIAKIDVDTVAKIYYGNHWSKEIRDEYNILDRNIQKCNKYKDNVEDICELLQNGVFTIQEIAKQLNVSESAVDGIKSGRYYTEISKDYDFSNVPDGHVLRHRLSITLDMIFNTEMSDIEISTKTEYDIDFIHNIRVKLVHDNLPKSYDHSNNMLSDEEIIALCELLELGNSIKEIKDVIKCTKGQFNHIYKRRSYLNITKFYDF